MNQQGIQHHMGQAQQGVEVEFPRETIVESETVIAGVVGTPPRGLPHASRGTGAGITPFVKQIDADRDWRQRGVKC